MPLFIPLLALALGSLAGCYGVGTGLLRLAGTARQEFYFDVFLRLLSGLVALTVGYAVAQTHGATVLLPLLPLLAGILCALRRAGPAPAGPPPGPARGPCHGLAVVLGVGAVVFGVQYRLVYEPGAPFLQTPFQDYVFYSRLTLPLNQLGLESNWLETVFPQFQTVQPYHYFESWLNALLVRTTGLPSVWVFFVSTATVLISGCGVGFAALYAQGGVGPRWALPLGLLSLTITGTAWPGLGRLAPTAYGGLLAHMPLALNPKLAPIYLFVLLVALLLLRQRYRAAGLALAAVPLAFVAAAPAIGLGTAGLAAYLWVSRRLSFGRALGVVLPALLAVAYLGAFYWLQPAPYRFPAAGPATALAAALPVGTGWRTLVAIAGGVLLKYAVYFGGYGLLLGLPGLLGRRTRPSGPLPPPDRRPLLAWFGATLLGAVLMRTAGHRHMDGFQFFSNPMIPLTAVLVAAELARRLRGTAGVRPALAAGGLAALGSLALWTDTTQNTRFSADFLRQVGPVLRALPPRGGYLLADADYENAYMLASDMYTAGTYVANFKNDYALLSLSALVADSLGRDPRYARDSVPARLVQEESSLYRLAEFRRRQGRPLPPDSLPLALVRRAGLAFVCASRRAVLPAGLRPLVQVSYRDAYSGEVLYVLKPRPPAAGNHEH